MQTLGAILGVVAYFALMYITVVLATRIVKLEQRDVKAKDYWRAIAANPGNQEALRRLAELYIGDEGE